MDIANFFENLADNFAGVVQYNKDNRPGSKITIDTVRIQSVFKLNAPKYKPFFFQLCDILVNETIGTPVTRLANVNDLLLNSSSVKCLDYKYDKMINEMKNVSWNSSAEAGGEFFTISVCLSKQKLEKQIAKCIFSFNLYPALLF